MARYGLVIGNSKYERNPLDNTVNDAKAVHQALVERGFDSSLICNTIGNEIAEAVADLKAKLSPGDILFFFFAGHAYEHLGYGCLLQVDIAEFTAGAIYHGAYHVDELLRETQDLDLVRVIVLDACRVEFDNVDYSSRAINERIHEDRVKSEREQSNLLLSYSTSYGDVALDGQEANSRFTKHLKKLLLNHKLSIEEMFKEVGCLVIRDTENRQRPWFYSSLQSDVKMSDLPTYRQRQSFYASTKESLYALAASHSKDQLLLVRDGKYFQFLSGQGPEGSYGVKDGVKAACISNSGEVYFIDGRDRLLIPGLSGGVDLEGIEPINVVTGGDGKYILVYGLQDYVVFRNGESSLDLVCHVCVEDQYFHCASFISDSEVWVGGNGQEIHAVRLGFEEVKTHTIQLNFSEYVYAITPYREGLVLIATSCGKVYMISQGAEISGLVVSLGESVRLPSSRRSCLISSVGDDRAINNFIFSPKLLSSEALVFMKGELQSNHLLYMVRANTLPIVAIGSSEGVITIIDTRNWDAYQELDASGGRETEITGLAFTADNTLVVSTKDSHVLFYAPINEDYSASLAYVDSHVEKCWEQD